MKDLFRKLGMMAGALLLCAYAAVALRGPNGFSALAEKRHQIQQLQEQNATLAADNARKRERIELLKHDRATQDLEIRQRLKLMKPGETQFIVSEPVDKPSGDTPAPGSGPAAVK